VAAADTGDTGSTARRIVLGGQLRQLREAKGISRLDAGYVIRASESKISRMELGRVGFKERDVADLLSLYEVKDEEERDSLLELVRASNRPGWWYRYSDTMPRWFRDYVGLEESASRIQTFETQFVPGLLQTDEYARAVVSVGLPDATQEELENRVALRLRRQRILTYTREPRLWAVIDEAVLHREVGDPGVMRDQIKYLLDITKQPTVSLQVVPFTAGGGGAEGPFTLLRFGEPELPDIAYLEHLAGALYLDKAPEVELYTKVFHRLIAEAEPPASSRQRLANMLRDL
jgi:transcriptional regulator with XRE-family HTH domain